MRKYIKTLGVISLALYLSACNFLNTEPKDLTVDNYFNTEQEVASYMAAVYNPLMQEHFYGNAFPLYINGGDDLSFFQRSTPTTSMICANTNSSDPYVFRFWRILYEGINRANLLLENVDKPKMSDATREFYRAEAKFLRAFYYFNLVQGWGDVPFRTSSTQTTVGLSAPRTDKQVIYDFIISEMEAALPHLKNVNEYTYSGRVTKSAVQGILARVYLFRAGEHFRDKKAPDANTQKYFEEAKKWALQVKESGLHGLVRNYWLVFKDMAADKYNSHGVNESIWEVEMAGTRATVEQAAGRVGNTFGFGANVDFSTNPDFNDLTGRRNPGYSYMFIFASEKLFELYEEEKDTARGDWNIAPFKYVTEGSGLNTRIKGLQYFNGKKPAVVPNDGLEYTEGTASDLKNKARCAAKFRREYEVKTPKHKNFTPQNFPILRYSDVLLMIAEAENEINGPTALAKECINLVRSRASLPNVEADSKEDFRDAIKRERAMELCFEGIRRYDMIRWGDYYRSMRDMQSLVEISQNWPKGLKYAAEYYRVTEAYNYLPIPALEMSVNPDIKFNNPGW